MNKVDLVARVAETTGLPRGEALKVVEAVLSAVEDGLKAKEEVRLTGFGTFSLATRKATTGRHPRTGEPMPIAELITVRFKPGRSLKESVGSTEPE